MNKICKTACPYDCPDTCGLLVETDGSRIYKVKGDPNHPVTRGFLCRKMQHYEEDVHSPDRITRPYKRIGKKGEQSSFVPIEWEEALDIIEEKWKSIIADRGADAIMPYSYAGNMGIINRDSGEAFFNELGAATVLRTICADAQNAGTAITMGKFRDWKSETLVDSDCIIIWSDNVKATRIHSVPFIMEAKKKGADIIIIDVHKNISADLATQLILTKPGTDSALILALMNLLDQKGYLDPEFIDKYTTGFDALKNEYSSWTPEKASEITGVSVDQIHFLAEKFGKARKPMMVVGSGLSRYTNGGATCRLLMCLPALIGAWSRGGGTSGAMGSSRFVNKQLISHPEWVNPEARVLNMNQLGWALNDKENPISSLYVYISNPLAMSPDQNSVKKGLLRDDLFVIVHDRFFTDTALYADIVLPATFQVENDDLFTSYGHYHFQAGWKAIQAPGQCKSNWDTFCLLADRMGFVHDMWQKTERQMAEYLLEHPDFFTVEISDQDRQALYRGDPIMFSQQDVLTWNTDDGKIHLTPESPAYQPLKDQAYPFRIVMNHSPWSLNSNFSHRKSLMESRGPLTLKISTEDAKNRNLEDGEICYAVNKLGKVKITIAVADGVSRGTLIAEGVYEKRWTHGEGNFSALISQQLTDYGKASSLNTNTVDLIKIY